MANPKFSRDYYLRTSDFDRFENIQPSSVLDLFQDVAGHHADILGIGRDKMLERNLVWVLTRVKYQVVKPPELYSKVRVTTRPLSPSKLIFQRDYIIDSESGELLIRGTSDWVFMDINTRSFASVGALYPYDENEETPRSFTEKMKKLRDFEAEGDGYHVVPSYFDLDMNGHVNNTKYANFVINFLSPSEKEIIDTLQIDYHREVKMGENLTLYRKDSDDGVLIKGVNGDGERMFSCSVTFKKF